MPGIIVIALYSPKTRKSELLSWVLAADDRVWEASTTPDVALETQSVPGQEVAGNWDELILASSTFSVDFEYKPAYARNEPAAGKNTTGKLGTEEVWTFTGWTTTASGQSIVMFVLLMSSFKLTRIVIVRHSLGYDLLWTRGLSSPRRLISRSKLARGSTK